MQHARISRSLAQPAVNNCQRCRHQTSISPLPDWRSTAPSLTGIVEDMGQYPRPPHSPRARVYRIVQIGSLRNGWAIEVDGVITRSASTAAPLGAWRDARLAGASEYDADDIAKVIERRPWPSYEERRAVFFPSGRPEPSRELFAERSCS